MAEYIASRTSIKLALDGGFMLGLFTVKVEGRKPSFTIEFNSRDLFKFQNRFLGTFHSFLPEDWLHFSFSSCRQRRNDALFDRNCIFDCTLDNPFFWCDAVVYHKTCTFYFQNGSSSFVIPLSSFLLFLCHLTASWNPCLFLSLLRLFFL